VVISPISSACVSITPLGSISMTFVAIVTERLLMAVTLAGLATCNGLLAPAIGQCHTLREILLSDEKPPLSRSADIIFCDSIAKRSMRSARVVHYRLIAQESLKYILTAMKSF
jgi:hypothetical protein